MTSENNINTEELIALETKRLSDKYGKSFLDCEDLIQITGLGRDNVRALMSRSEFKVVQIGKRKVVSIINFVIWQFTNN